MKKYIITLLLVFLSTFAYANNNDEYTILKEHKNYTSIMRIIVKNDKIVSVSYDRKDLNSKSWVIDYNINRIYKQKYGETYREMKIKLIRAAQTKNIAIPEVKDKELYAEFKEMFEYLLLKIVNKENGTYKLEIEKVK